MRDITGKSLIQSPKEKPRFLTAASRRGRSAIVALAGWGVFAILGCGGNPTDPPLVDSSTQRTEPVAVATVTPAAPALLSAPEARLMEPLLDPQAERAEFLLKELTSASTTPEKWEEAHDELLTLGDAGITVLISALKAGSDVERELASTTLAIMGGDNPQVGAVLLAALKDESRFVQANAAAALLVFPEHADAAISTLITFLEQDDPQLRQVAALNLSSVGADASPYISSLKRSLTQENSPEVTTAIVELLGRIGNAAEPALPVLRQIVFEQPGEVGTAAQSAIQLIEAGDSSTATAPSSSEASP